MSVHVVDATSDSASAAMHRICTVSSAPYVPAFHMAGQALIRLNQTDEAAAMLRDGIDAARTQNDLHALGEMESLLATVD